MITSEMKMAELIHINYQLLSVLDRFGIRLGFGDKQVKDVCRFYKIDTNFFLEIVNTFHDKDYFPSKSLQDFSVEMIINYLRKTHDYYHEKKVPEIEEIIDQLEKDCKEQTNNIKLLRKFFIEYKEELIHHTKKEDNLVFPYASAVEKLYSGKDVNQKEKDVLKQYSMKTFKEEHDNIEEKLYDLKNIIIKYLPPTKKQSTSIHLLELLFQLEKDLNDHARIEDKVMVPKIMEMEKHLRQTKN